MSRKRWQAVRLLVLLVIGVAGPFLLHRDELAILTETIAGPAVVSAERSLSAARITRGPPIVWIRIDDRESGPETPRPTVAALLERIRTGSHRPELVYLDVAVGERARDRVDETPLERALAGWSADRRAPPLAIFAGRGCAPPVPPADLDPAEQDLAIIFNPERYARWVGLSSFGRVGGGARIAWSCPTFAGLYQAEWSCVTTPPDPHTGVADVMALPSPAWFARSARTSRSATNPAMLKNLEAADLVCRGRDPHEVAGLRPPYSRVAFDYEGAGRLSGLETARAAGDRLLLTRVPAETILQPDSGTSSLAGAIVVIGTGNRWIDDRVQTDMGLVPGSLLVAAAMREAWEFGLHEPAPRWLDALLIGLLFALGAYLARVLLPWARQRRMQKKKRAKFIMFLLLNEQVVVPALIAIAFLMPWLFGRLTFPLVISMLLTEILILTDMLEEEWHGAKA